MYVRSDIHRKTNPYRQTCIAALSEQKHQFGLFDI